MNQADVDRWKGKTMSEIEDLKKELKALKDQINPPPREPFHMPRFDPTEGMSMPRSAMQAMVDASSSYMADLRADARKPNPVTASQSPLSSSSSSQPTSQVQRGTGYRDAVPLGPPPGIEHCDRLVDAQDKIDRAELALKLAKADLGKGK
jgi:hypothetical protein